MKVVLQMYINENLGDDLFIDIIAKKYPNIDFTIFGIGNRKIPEIYGQKYKNVHIIKCSSLSHKLNIISKIVLKKDFLLEKTLKKSNGLITLGGSVFIDSPNKFESIKANILADVRMHALKIKKPTFVIGANFGPVYHNKYIEKYEKYFKKCVNVSFRDVKSKEQYSNLKNVTSAPDVVFNYKKIQNKQLPKTIGLSLIDLSDSSHLKIAGYKEIYERKIIEIINRLASKGYDLNLYSFCSKQGDTEVNSVILREIKDKSKIKIHNYEALDTDSFIKDLTSNEYIIATRFHSMILGLIHQQKVFPIVYDIKTQNVIDELNLKNYCTLDNIEKLCVEDILKVQEYKNVEKIQKNAHMQFKAFEEYYCIDTGDKNE